jgi:hypothetical protein
MKLRTIHTLLCLLACLALPAFGQETEASLPAPLFPASLSVDTLPAITMKFEPAYLILWMVVPAGSLIMGGHSYKINEKKTHLASDIRPYFEATHDKLLLDLYQQHKRNRVGWYVATGTGSMLFTAGFIHYVASIFNYDYIRSAQAYLLVGTGMVAGGLAARVVCFRTLRKAVNL